MEAETPVTYGLVNIEQNTEYTISYIAVGGSLSGGSFPIQVTSPAITVVYRNNDNLNSQYTFTTSTQNNLRFTVGVGRVFTNYQFKLQLEKRRYSNRL